MEGEGRKLKTMQDEEDGGHDRDEKNAGGTWRESEIMGSAFSTRTSKPTNAPPLWLLRKRGWCVRVLTRLVGIVH